MNRQAAGFGGSKKLPEHARLGPGVTLSIDLTPNSLALSQHIAGSGTKSIGHNDDIRRLADFFTYEDDMRT